MIVNAQFLDLALGYFVFGKEQLASLIGKGKNIALEEVIALQRLQQTLLDERVIAFEHGIVEVVVVLNLVVKMIEWHTFFSVQDEQLAEAEDDKLVGVIDLQLVDGLDNFKLRILVQQFHSLRNQLVAVNLLEPVSLVDECAEHVHELAC